MTRHPHQLTDVIGITEAARLCEVTPQTLRNWEADKYGPKPFRKPGSAHRKYVTADVVEFLDNPDGFDRNKKSRSSARGQKGRK